MKLLSEMDEEQTLLLNSGLPLGLMRSSPQSPRVVISNGMVLCLLVRLCDLLNQFSCLV